MNWNQIHDWLSAVEAQDGFLGALIGIIACAGWAWHAKRDPDCAAAPFVALSYFFVVVNIFLFPAIEVMCR